MQAIFRFFFVYLTSRASDTLKVQTDYLTFDNLITTGDTTKVQSSEAIAVEESLLKLYAAIIIVFFSFTQDISPEYYRVASNLEKPGNQGKIVLFG